MELFQGPMKMSGYAGEKINANQVVVTMCIYDKKGPIFFVNWNSYAEHMVEEHPDILIELLEYQISEGMKYD